MKKYLAILSLFLTTTVYLQAQATGRLTGTVIDADSGDALNLTAVIVRSAGKAMRTDFDGKFNMELPPGQHKVEFKYSGYDPVVRDVTIQAGKTVNVNVTLGAKTLDTVNVQGRGLNKSESALLQLQKKSGTVSDGISEEAIKKSPDSSAGDVLRRVTGITLVGGKFVFVRGLGERYSTTVLNDSVVPSTEPDKRVIPLDLFPASVIKNIRIIKTFAPEDSGEFSGGVVKIETKDYPDKLEASIGFGLGYNSITTGRAFQTFEGGGMANLFGMTGSNQKLPGVVSSLPDILPLSPTSNLSQQAISAMAVSGFSNDWSSKEITAPWDKSFNLSFGNTYKLNQNGDMRLGVLLGSTYSRNFRYRQTQENRYSSANSINPLLTDFTSLNLLKKEDVQTWNEEVNFGNNVNVTFQLKEGQQIYYKLLHTIQSDKIVRSSFGYNNIDTFNYINNSLEWTSRTLFNQTVGGTHAWTPFGDRPHKFEWHGNFARAERDQPDLRNQLWQRSINSTSSNFTRTGNPDGQRYFSNTTDDVASINAKYTVPFKQWDGLQSKLKFGATALDRTKLFRFREFQQNLAAAPGMIDLYPVPGEITYNPITLLNGDRQFRERFGDNNAYNAGQKLHAYFLQLEMPIASKLNFLGGARYEDSSQTVATFALRDSYLYETSLSQIYGSGCSIKNSLVREYAVANGICQADNNGIGNLRTRDLLPSANLTWEFKEDMNLRLGYSETVTRPDLRELSPFYFSPYFAADRIQGNSNLNRTYIHNYDLRYEWYLTATDYIGAAIFKKRMSDPIEQIGIPVAGQPQVRYTFANAKQGDIEGIELDYRKDFWNHFRIEGNLFFIKSKVTVLNDSEYYAARLGFVSIYSELFGLAPTDKTRSLQGQSERVFNLKFTYFPDQEKHHSLGLYYNYFSERIVVVGGNGVPNAIHQPAGVLDFIYGWQKGEHLDLKFAVRNITNTMFKATQVDNVYGVEQTYFKYREGISISISASYKM
ncbi:TonB-dependent receptor domain-containing protein [Leptospira sp. B5-022]|uniref:TonB-dependent receptor domain-containing protein n=3 Tax=unclassified Leptospira TaxID=2633828 RepID=UPI0002BF8561|nr:TonB-dependent receptor [Leptospira sp. B5-022]EMJ99167.1 TonB-dependent receptor [Leptospira sp. B5-022]